MVVFRLERSSPISEDNSGYLFIQIIRAAALREFEELLGTKLRALYQRKKGRDLYDLWLAITSIKLDDRKIVECFERYLVNGGISISRAEFEENLVGKLRDPAFIDDMDPLLPTGVNYNIAEAGELIRNRLVAMVRGEPWKGKGNVRPRGR